MSEENVDCKPDLLSNMSHEMRSALNIIMASCTMAEDHIDDKVRVRDHLKRIFAAVDHLTNLINDYLDICRIKDGKSFLAEEEFFIGDLGEELKLLMEPLAEEKNISFSITTEGFEGREVVGDYGRLLQILINLAANSIKYTSEGGTVLVAIEVSDETDVEKCSNEEDALCRITCGDNGIGISEDFLQHIYEPFARADDERVRLTGGTGLGMTIVKEMVETMGGSIHIDSVIDVGTTVTILIKLKKNIGKG